MEINAQISLDIFRNNFDFEIVDTIFGKAVKMSNYDAFLYSNVTGAGYLDNYVMPFTPKGLMKIFRDAFHYHFVTGIFDNYSLKYSPYYLSITKPYLFENDKYILFIEFESENELRSKLKNMILECKDKNIKSTDFIIQRIEKIKNGNGMESFMEYITCEYFKKHGYIVENQIPLLATVGSPDFGGYSLSMLKPEDANQLTNLLGNGFHIIELSMIRLFHKKNRNHNIIENGNIVAEAKTSTKIMAEQLEKYLNTGLFSKGFELHPTKEKPTFDSFGLINLMNNKININYPNKVDIYEEKYSRDEYEIWLTNYIKFYLISNLANDELLKFYKMKTNNEKYDSIKLINFVKNCSIEEILKVIMEVK